MTCSIEAMLRSFWREGSPATGLPALAYVDEAFWRTECESVFADNWVCVGFRHEFKRSGDAIPINVGGKPILLVMNANEEVSAFHNICRHRCLLLVDRPKNVGRLINCPYHAWAYGLDGKLRASPHFGGRDNHRPGGFEPDAHGLIPIRSHVWQDWIFVNLGGGAPPFETYAEPFLSRLEGIDFDKVKPVAMLDFGEVETNWKFIMENFIEPYHVQFVHSITTTQPLRNHYTVAEEPCFGSAVDLDEEIGGSGSLAVSSRYLTLFPNFIVGRYFPDQLGVYLNVPLGPTRTSQRRVIYTTEGQDMNGDEIEELKKLWWSVHKEDHAICERLQQGRGSPVASGGGVLSPHWEDSVRRFQEMVAASVVAKVEKREDISNDE
jgi:choline monooxygenase